MVLFRGLQARHTGMCAEFPMAVCMGSNSSIEYYDRGNIMRFDPTDNCWKIATCRFV